jgi:hypothetical protein
MRLQSGAAGGKLEEGFNLIGKNSFSFHARGKIGIIEIAVPHGPDAVKNFCRPVRLMLLEPRLE